MDPATGEWVAVEVAPPPLPPVQVVVTTTNSNGPGVSYFSPPVVAVQAASVAPAPPATRAPRPQWNPNQLLHPDVLLPLVGAVIVLIVFIAWAS